MAIERVIRGLPRVMRMFGPRSHIVVLLLFGMCGLAFCAQTNGTPVVTAPAVADGLDPELALIKDHLFNNKDSGTRVSAATVLLFKEDPAARELVLGALK